MRSTYDEAIAQVFKDEGGYSNIPSDHGGPTNYGITIHDARLYWKPDASAEDVRKMPKSVASDIYREHYARVIGYDSLAPGVDYAVLDYSINSGAGRALTVYRSCKGMSAVDTINAIYDERTAFLKALGAHPSQAKFLPGWLARCKRGRVLALRLNEKYSTSNAHNKTAGGIVIAGGAAATQYPHIWPYIIAGTVVTATGAWLLIKYIRKGK